MHEISTRSPGAIVVTAEPVSTTVPRARDRRALSCSPPPVVIAVQVPTPAGVREREGKAEADAVPVERVRLRRKRLALDAVRRNRAAGQAADLAARCRTPWLAG